MRARLHLIKQPNVFNRYHRLIGKCGEKFDLLVGKWLYFHATNKDRTNCLIVSQQRHRQYCSYDRQCVPSWPRPETHRHNLAGHECGSADDQRKRVP